ncbi:TetR/AcrR family transcriptional regulator [Martelella soudanensis]|uniref:TetR/AcrR family transcriptional regulator n=1 Tax=unclassified Martelella TaxID=2629616 RepID=UPI0015DE3BDC|nr:MULTISPECIES: TetR/AcrR family transcriptional regulator [unclassified Martelella]
MDADTEKNAGWRGSRALWLDAARQAFVETGLDAVRIQALAHRLSLSRTSFYWFFKDRAALLDALLEHWEDTNTGALIEACDAYAETLTEGILNLISVFIAEAEFDPRLDFSVRGWAAQSADVTARVASADSRRISAIKALFVRFGFAQEEADVRAHAVYLVQIGYISLQVTEDTATRVERAAEYVRIYTGQAPDERELARFRARHGC